MERYFKSMGNRKLKIANFLKYKEERNYKIEMLEHLDVLDILLNDVNNVTLDDVQEWLDEAWEIFNENSTNFRHS